MFHVEVACCPPLLLGHLPVPRQIDSRNGVPGRARVRERFLRSLGGPREPNVTANDSSPSPGAPVDSRVPTRVKDLNQNGYGSLSLSFSLGGRQGQRPGPYLEAGFGRCSHPLPEIFPGLYRKKQGDQAKTEIPPNAKSLSLSLCLFARVSMSLRVRVLVYVCDGDASSGSRGGGKRTTFTKCSQETAPWSM